MAKRTAADPRQLHLDWGEVWEWIKPGSRSVEPAPLVPVVAPLGPTEPLCDQPAQAITPEAPPQTTAITGLQHPQANRHIVLNGQALGYLLQRRRRRTIGMRIAHAGLEVAAPAWVGVGEIERVLHEKAGWIVRKLQQQAQQQDLQAQNKPVWQDGQYLPWRGGLLQVRLAGRDPAAAQEKMTPARIRRVAMAAQLRPAEWLHAEQEAANNPTSCVAASSTLWLDLPVQAPAADVRAVISHWAQQQALAIFTGRMQHYAPMLGVQWKELKLSQAQGRWGSATSRGVIRLHWRLVQMPPEVLDYVVVHELAHLHEMNHGPRFWAWVEKVLPDYRQRQYRLKHTTLAPW